ncbi:hypothetical protein CerSpe_147670 [Prunus speciosa]
MPVARPETSDSRVIAHVDMDCFYVQAETMLAEAPPEILEVIDEEVLKSHVLGLNSEDGSDAKESVRKWLSYFILEIEWNTAKLNMIWLVLANW